MLPSAKARPLCARDAWPAEQVDHGGHAHCRDNPVDVVGTAPADLAILGGVYAGIAAFLADLFVSSRVELAGMPALLLWLGKVTAVAQRTPDVVAS